MNSFDERERDRERGRANDVGCYKCGMNGERRACIVQSKYQMIPSESSLLATTDDDDCGVWLFSLDAYVQE